MLTEGHARESTSVSASRGARTTGTGCWRRKNRYIITVEHLGIYNMPLKVNATDKTPSFEYIPKSGTFHVIGVSVPKDAKSFYDPIIEWVDGFCSVQKTDSRFIINIDLDYFSASSIVKLIVILKKLSRFDRSVINWIYEDDELLEAGEDLSTMINLQFNMIRK